MKKITIVSPSKHIEEAYIIEAEQELEKANFHVETSRYATRQCAYFSGTTKERLHDLQTALDDASTDFILCSRGGYGAVQLVEQLSFQRYMQRPKPIIGFSDITVLHCKMHQLGLPSIHACMPISLNHNSLEAKQSLFNALNKQQNQYDFQPNPLNRTGTVSAPIIGGNLSIICSVIGTPLDIDTTNRILFFEDVGEAIYKIERMLWQLKMAGKFDHLKGLIIGGLTDIKDTVIPYNKTVECVISEMVADYTFPLCFNFPAGHIDDNRTIILGKKALISIGKERCHFKQA